MPKGLLQQVRSIGDLVALRAQATPEALAYSILTKRGAQQECLSYGELYVASRDYALNMAALAAPGERVLVSTRPGAEFLKIFFATQLAGLIAVPVNPGNARDADCKRIWRVVEDANARMVLCEDTATDNLLAHPARIDTTLVMGPAQLAAHGGGTTLPQSTSEVAYLQYTSGSTGIPKGVMVGQDNVLHNSALICESFRHTPDSVGVIWLPPYHDMGLVGGIIQPMYAGFPVHLMEPAEFIKRPATWLEAISRFGATTSGGPNFAYDYCLKRIAEEARDSFNLSRWRVAFCGAEPIAVDTLRSFQQAFSGAGFQRDAFYSCYGLAEATLYVTGRHIDPSRVSTPVSCGYWPKDTDLTIDATDLSTGNEESALPEGPVVGEICVWGRSVAKGYWGKDAETENTFPKSQQLDGGGFVRTGDLGYVSDGELYIVGRKKNLIIIRGKNFSPEDIEAAVSANLVPLAGQLVAALGMDEGDGEQLVILAELGARDFAKADQQKLARKVMEVVNREFGLAVGKTVFLRAGRLPRTDTGKIKRPELRALVALSAPTETLAQAEAIRGSTDG